MFKLKKRKTGVFGVLISLVMGLLPGLVFAHGPARPEMFTMEQPAPYVIFNSIKNNPVVGDERDFVRIREVGSGQDFSNKVELKPGKVYEIYAAYHNNAAKELNASGKGLAHGVRMAGVVSQQVKAGETTTMSVVISAKNANPKQVWDEAYGVAKEDLALKYVKDSAVIHTKAKDKHGNTVNGMKLSGLFTKEGALLGVGKLDGVLPGCAEWSGHVTFQIMAEGRSKPQPQPQPEPKVESGKGKLTKQVSIDGENYSGEVQAKEDNEVFYRVVFENEGKGKLSKIKFKDEMSAGTELVANSVKVTYEDGKTVKEKNFSKQIEFEVGELAEGKKIVIDYKVKIKEVKCGKGEYVNTFKVKFEEKAGDGEKELESKAKVVTDKRCEEEPEPEPVQPSEPVRPKEKVPETGPAEVAFVVLILGGIGGGTWYFMHTKKALKRKMAVAGVGNAKNKKAEIVTSAEAGQVTSPEIAPVVPIEEKKQEGGENVGGAGV